MQGVGWLITLPPQSKIPSTHGPDVCGEVPQPIWPSRHVSGEACVLGEAGAVTSSEGSNPAAIVAGAARATTGAAGHAMTSARGRTARARVEPERRRRQGQALKRRLEVPLN
jgi:hypothetical protein